MILTANDVLNSGFAISDDISVEVINKNIMTAELFWLKPQITDESYIDLLDNPTTEEHVVILNGGEIEGKYVAGLKFALINYVYALILVDSLRVTRYGTVEKTSEYSAVAPIDKVQFKAEFHAEIAQMYLQDLDFYFELTNVRNDLFNKLYF